MNDVYSLVKLFGERYIFCDQEQAESDVEPNNREEMIDAFAAILDVIRTKVNHEFN